MTKLNPAPGVTKLKQFEIQTFEANVATPDTLCVDEKAALEATSSVLHNRVALLTRRVLEMTVAPDTFKRDPTSKVPVTRPTPETSS